MSEPVVHSHWHQSISGLSITPTEFYEAVAQAIDAKNIPDLKIEGKYYAEGMIGSAQLLTSGRSAVLLRHLRRALRGRFLRLLVARRRCRLHARLPHDPPDHRLAALGPHLPGDLLQGGHTTHVPGRDSLGRALRGRRLHDREGPARLDGCMGATPSIFGG